MGLIKKIENNWLNLVFSSLLLGVSMGCQSQYKISKEIPGRRKFFDLCRQENIIGKNDCSNKSAEFTRYLTKRGYDAKVLVIEDDGWKDLHAIVKLNYRGKEIYLDPTLKKSGGFMYPGSRLIRIVPEKELYLNEGEYIKYKEKDEKPKKHLETKKD